MDNVNVNPSPSNKSFGPIIGLVIILVIIILGSIYYFSTTKNQYNPASTQNQNNQVNQNANSQISQTAALEPANIIKQGSTDATLEADLNATNVNGIDAEIQ